MSASEPGTGVDAGDPGVAELLGRTAETIVAQLFPDADRRAAHLGEAFLACERALREQPAAFREAARRGELEELLTPRVRGSLTRDAAAGPSGGWLGTYLEADGRAIESDAPDSTDREALALGQRALKRALSLARAERNETLLRNLRWYQARLAHRSYASIAEAEGKVAATVRTGVARARKFVLGVVHGLQHAQPAPLSGEAPPEVEPLRRLWLEQDLDRLERELERTRERHGDDPHWLNLAALLAADRGRHPEALRLYERGLVFADAPSVRGRVLNNLGNLMDDRDDVATARVYWLRAHQLVPCAPAPLLNLLAAVAAERDYASAQHFIARLGELMSSGKLDAGERAYVARRLAGNPKLAWLRETDAWRLGPARWLRARDRRPARIVAAVSAALLLALLALLPVQARAYPQRALDAGVERAEPPAAARELFAGGDSMGKPGKRGSGGARRTILLAGDSMGFGGNPRPRPRPPIRR